jgi:gliding motility-associated protein GldL
MAAKGGTSIFWDRIIPVFYSVGAAVVILGALFKLRHLEGSDIMLTVGLGTEALIFLIYALQTFLRPESNYAWEKVYPELDEDFKGELPTKSMVATSSGPSLTAKMDEALANSRITPDIFDNLKTSFRSLSETANKMSDLSDATVATKEYAVNVKAASGQVAEMNKSYGNAMQAINSMAEVTRDTQDYKAQFQKVTQNMSALNAVYELELQDTNKHLKSMNSFYGGLSSAMENMGDAARDTQQFKAEIAKLTQNLNSLNAVYGSMLTAMRG